MSRHSARRPILLPGISRLWRDPHRLQLGTDPHCAVVLELADPGWARLLDLLDGRRTEDDLRRDTARLGVPDDQVVALLAALRTAGLVVDRQSLGPSQLTEAVRRRLHREATASALRDPGRRPGTMVRRRLAARILISGSSLLAEPITYTLAAAGIGHVDPKIEAGAQPEDALAVLGSGLASVDPTQPRAAAATERIRRTFPEINLSSLRPGDATFAVLVGPRNPATLTALRMSSRGLVHLAVMVRDGAVVVGPLVHPGRTPCLHCLDLHRQDRDPAWSEVAAQLHTGAGADETVAAVTALAGVAYAAAEVLRHVDGEIGHTVGATVEITEPGRLIRRQWSHHPACDCRRRPSSPPRRTPVRQAECFN
ncbi:MAG TPA: TOMM precursor leader peptide-binding protein [Micromonosporaceae bacterium]